MKQMKIITAALLSAIILQGCASTSTEQYKKLKADSMILCGGSLDGINYQTSPYNTTIQCNGKTFRFSKTHHRGILSLFD